MSAELAMGTRHDPSQRWDLLLAIQAPTDTDCLSAFATTEGVETLSEYPNIVARAAKVFPRLPELLSTLPTELVAAGVQATLSGADIFAPVNLDDVGDLFG